jgi:hypothetical protein
LIYKDRALHEGRFTSFHVVGDNAKGGPEIDDNWIDCVIMPVIYLKMNAMKIDIFLLEGLSQDRLVKVYCLFNKIIALST